MTSHMTMDAVTSHVTTGSRDRELGREFEWGEVWSGEIRSGVVMGIKMEMLGGGKAFGMILILGNGRLGGVFHCRMFYADKTVYF